MREDVRDAKDQLQKIGDVFGLVEMHKFEYEKSVDKVLESKEVQANLKQAADAMLDFWDRVEQLHNKLGK